MRRPGGALWRALRGLSAALLLLAAAPPLAEARTKSAAVVKWKTKLAGHVRSSPFYHRDPVEQEETVYAGCVDGSVYAIDAADGAVRWSFDTGGEVHASPLVDDGVLYVGSESGKLFALDAVKGNKLWEFDAGDKIHSSPVAYAGTVYIGSEHNYLFAIKAGRKGGKLQWKVATGGDVDSTPFVKDGMVYIGSFDGKVHALKAANGKQVWEHDTGGVIRSSPILHDGVLYVASDDKGVMMGSIWALDAASGEKKWRSRSVSGTVHSTPVVDEEHKTLILGSQNYEVLALRIKNGKVKWRYKTGGFVDSSPVLTNGFVVVGSYDRFVYKLTASGGKLVWKFRTGGYVHSTPALDPSGTVFIGSKDDHLYALQQKDWEINDEL